MEKILWLIVSQLGGGHGVSPLGVVVSIVKGVEEAVSDWAKGLLHLTHGSDYADGKKEIELVEALRLVRGLGKDVKKHSPEDHIRVLDLVERFVDRLQKGMESDPIHDHPTARRMGQLFDISLAAVKGLFREGVITGEKTFSDLDDKELKEFLKEHAEFRIGLDSESLHKTFSTPKGYWTSVPYEHKMDGVFAVKLIKSN
ncbi:hypothetical protein IH922_08265 [candidate division KSB1 bacterium]|nr:hypothetical protein [candidate division KSB1 bacterium]